VLGGQNIGVVSLQVRPLRSEIGTYSFWCCFAHILAFTLCRMLQVRAAG
jgi:hypothetical protein